MIIKYHHNQIKERLQSNLEKKYPELFLYIDDPYIEELKDALIDVFSEELSNICDDIFHVDI